MRAIITGGCGFLGSNLAAGLVASSWPVCLFDNLSRIGSSENLAWVNSLGDLRFERGDIRDLESCVALVKSFRPDVIFHFAGQVAMTTSISNPREDFEINTLGTINILEAIRLFAPDCSVIYSSTNKVYGDLAHISFSETLTRYYPPEFPEGLPESIPLSFHSPYGCSKGAADQYVLDYGRIFGIKSAVFRHSSMYGSRQYSTPDQGWIGWFCKEAIRQRTDRRPIVIAGNGKQVRDVLFCDDMVSLYMSAALNIESVSGEAYNIGGGIENSLSLLELFDELSSILEYPLNIESSSPRVSDQPFFVANLSKIRSKLDWSPLVSKESGLRSMVDWVRTAQHS